MKIVIVGGVAGGATAAARARRLDETAEIILIQSGPDVSYASCGMPYFIGGEINDRSIMSVQTPKSLRERLNIDVHINTRVTQIDVKNQSVVTHSDKEEGTENTQNTIFYDQLILALGAMPYQPNLPGIHRPGLFVLRDLNDMDQIHAWLKQQDVSNTYGNNHTHCVIAGAGFIGLEMVEQLLRRKYKVTLVERSSQILAPLDPEMAAIVCMEMKKHGVEIITGDAIAAIEASSRESDPALESEGIDANATSSVIVLQSGRRLPDCQMTLLSLGIKPDTSIAKEAGIATTTRGHIVVDDFLRTSAPNVWAIGDAIEVNNPIINNGIQESALHEKWTIALAGPANRQGRMVADNIYCFNRKYKGTYGAWVLRVFNLMVASVGMNEKMLIEKKLPYEVVHVHPNSHASYYPGAKAINFKLLFCPLDGKLYGAQAIGEDGVEKRIDVISTAIQGGLTVHDLANLELCYAPPVGSAKDPVNIAGMAAENIIDGLVKQVDWKEMQQLIQEQVDGHSTNIFVLDVRNPSEITNTDKIFPTAINIPLNDLRSRIKELPVDKDTPLIVSCMSGQRAYYACRILMQNGYTHVRNLGGAFKTYSMIK